VRALLLLPLLAAVAQADPALAELLADAPSVAPGGTIRVGVRFQLEPHWHVYWKNPGDSGQPVSISWKLPEGVRASEIAWPAPERIPTPPFMTFGYETEVVLSSEITVPQGYAAASLPITADVEWLVCDENGCVPGEASLSKEFPVAPGDPPRTPIATGLPVPAGEVIAHYRGGRIVLLVTAPGSPAEAAAEAGAPSFFFPAEADVIEPAETQHAVVQGDRKGLLLTPVKTRDEPVKVLRGVLAFESGPAWEVEVPVEPDAPSGSRVKWITAAAAVAFAYVAHRMIRRRKERMS